MNLKLLHIPKTGGSALAWGLRGSGVERHGHSFRTRHLKGDDMVVTLVRDPVERFLSIWGWFTTTYPEWVRWDSPAELIDEPALDIGQDLDLLRPQSWWLEDPDRAYFIGRTERLDVDFERLRAMLGLGPQHRLPPVGHKNRNTGPPHIRPDPRLIARIRDRYADDHALLT